MPGRPGKAREGKGAQGRPDEARQGGQTRPGKALEGLIRPSRVCSGPQGPHKALEGLTKRPSKEPFPGFALRSLIRPSYVRVDFYNTSLPLN
jgi:hypothetical protein